MSVGPPRLAVWLLAARVPDEWREFVLGDLEEEFAERGAASPASASWWFWRQAVRCFVAPPRPALARRTSPPPPGDP